MDSKSPKIRSAPLRTCWQADDIEVTRGDECIDRWCAEDIERVTLVHIGAGDSPIEIHAAIFELPGRVVVLGAQCGIAGRVLFERETYWARRNCIYWVSNRRVSWLVIEGESRWQFARQAPPYQPLTPAQANALFERANAIGPQTWGQRKQWRFGHQRPFSGREVGATQVQGSLTI
jgi:hypothetical protein